MRTFWWYVAIVPTFGLAATLFGHGAVQILGLAGLVWPISIPARALLTTTKSARLLARGVFVSVIEDYVLFHGPDRQGLKIEIAAIRDVVERQRHLLVRTRRLGFLPIALDAFESETEGRAFGRELSAEVERRLAMS